MLRYGYDLLRGQAHENDWRVIICLLGKFRVLSQDSPVPVSTGGEARALPQILAVQADYSAPRDVLLDRLWPDTEASFPGQSLNTLVHSLRGLLGSGVGGAAAVVRDDRNYRLNVDAGIKTKNGATEATTQ